MPSVLVASVPLEERLEAVRQFAAEDPAERMVLFDLAVDPGDLVAWISRPNDRQPGAPLSRAEIEQLFQLRGEGLSYREVGERMGRPTSTVKEIGGLGREEALRRVQAREDRELERLIRAELEQRLVPLSRRR